MADPFLQLFTPGNTIVKRRKSPVWMSSYTVLKTVDQYEALISERRRSPDAQKSFWKAHPFIVVSLIGFLLLVLCWLLIPGHGLSLPWAG
jgi:hypothetical protein